MTTILIVDDNLLNLELAADVLELAGFDASHQPQYQPPIQQSLVADRPEVRIHIST